MRIYLDCSFALLAFGLARCLLANGLEAVRLLEELVDLLSAL